MTCRPMRGRRGRVVAVQEMAFLPADEARLTANLNATLAILSDLGLDIDRRPRAAAAVEYAEVIESEGGTGAVKLHLLEEALAVTNRVIAATPTSQRALVYRVRLLHLRALLTVSPKQRATLRAEANRAWRDTVAVRLAPKTPAPATSSDLSAAIFGESFADTRRRLHAVDTSRFWPRPVRRWEVAPVYAQRPATVPIVEIIIGPEGVVANARVVRGEPGVARSVLEAARLQFYTPPMVEGHASAWVELVTFPVGQ